MKRIKTTAKIRLIIAIVCLFVLGVSALGALAVPAVLYYYYEPYWAALYVPYFGVAMLLGYSLVGDKKRGNSTEEQGAQNASN